MGRGGQGDNRTRSDQGRLTLTLSTASGSSDLTGDTDKAIQVRATPLHATDPATTGAIQSHHQP